MSDELESIHNYIQAIHKELAAGNTTEHSLRPALKTLLEPLSQGFTRSHSWSSSRPA